MSAMAAGSLVGISSSAQYLHNQCKWLKKLADNHEQFVSLVRQDKSEDDQYNDRIRNR